MVEGLVATDPFVGGNTGGYHRQDRWGQMLPPGYYRWSGRFVRRSKGGLVVGGYNEPKEINTQNMYG